MYINFLILVAKRICSKCACTKLNVLSQVQVKCMIEPKDSSFLTVQLHADSTCNSHSLFVLFDCMVCFKDHGPLETQ